MTGPRTGGRASRVRRTGIALVHAGELVLPAAGSAAEAEVVTHSDRMVVHYHFPVEIEVVDLGAAADHDEFANRTLERLLGGLQGEEG
ncbi:MAG: hypothetical protein WCY11_14135 [Novosphingobium sp.]